MRNLIIKLIIIILSFNVLLVTNTEAIFNQPDETQPYCNDPLECDMTVWTDIVKDNVNNIETTQTFTEYSQNIVKYILWFLFILALILIIYAWFMVMTASWDDSKVKKWKAIITYTIIWLIIIFLAYSIVLWLAWIVNAK